MGFYGTYQNGVETVVNCHRESVWSKPPPYHLEPCFKCHTEQGLKGSSTINSGVGLRYVGALAGEAGWLVICSECLNMTGIHSTPERAIADWNGENLFENINF